MTAPLQGIRVIDWTQVQSGPSCTQMLAWLGADVIKIERKGLGDPTRTELLDYPDMDSLYYLQLNCNKRSIELDMKTSEGNLRGKSASGSGGQTGFLLGRSA